MNKTILASAIILASAVTTAQAAAWQSEDGRLSIGGDVEINFDVKNNKNGATSNPETKGNTQTQLGDDSRVLTEIQWKDTKSDGSYITAKAQPLMKANGEVALDDSYFAFGMQDAWMFQIGRYEAMDLFPLGKDTVLAYAAGSDSIGSGVYYYMGKEARGRANDAGQARIVGEFDGWTAEVSTVYGDTKDILKDTHEYLDDVNANNIKSTDNSFIIRPAVNYISDNGDVSVSFGGEWEANQDSVTGTVSGTDYNLSNRS